MTSSAWADRSADKAQEALLLRHTRFLEALPTRWGTHRAEALIRERRTGWLRPLIWTSPTGTLGLALAEQSARGLRVHALQFADPSAERLDQWLGAFERSGGPCQSVCDLIEGIGPNEQARLFESRGFRHRILVELDLPEDVALPTPSEELPLRPLRPSDREAFVELYARVYSEPFAVYWVIPSPGADAEARLFFDQFVNSNGEWNDSVIRDASWVHEREDRMIGNVIVGRRDSGEPYVAGLAVDPEFQRRGIGRMLLLRALRAARDAAHGPVTLTVLRHVPAYRLYRSVGFRDVPPPEGRLPGYWIRERNGPDSGPP
jgi:GNAT superfamily N-acetyltransferase